MNLALQKELNKRGLLKGKQKSLYDNYEAALVREAADGGAAPATAEPRIRNTKRGRRGGPAIQRNYDANDILTSIGSGASAGFIDNAQAVASAAMSQIAGDRPEESFGESYDDFLEINRSRAKEFKEKNKALDTFLKISGGLAGMGKFGAGATLGKQALLGGAYGAAESIGSLDGEKWDPLDTLVQTGLGAAMPVVGDKVLNAVQKIKMPSLGKNAKNILDDFVKKTGLSKEELIAKADAMGADATLMDVGGDLGRGLGVAIKQQGDLGTATKMAENLSSRSNPGKRISAGVEDVLGLDKGYYKSLDNLIASRKSTANNLYENSRLNEKLRIDPELIGLMESKIGRDAIAIMRKRNKLDGDMSAVQNLKLSLDDAMKDASKGDSGYKNFDMKVAREQRAAIMDKLNKENPLFKEANDAFAGDSKLIDAQMLGKADTLGGKKVDETLESIGRMTSGEKDAFTQGRVSNIKNTIGMSDEEAYAGLKKIGNANSARELEQLVGKEKAGSLADIIKRETDFKATDALINNKATAAKEFRENMGGSDLPNLPSPLFSIPFAAYKLTGKALGYASKVNPEVLTEVADLISKPGGTKAALELILKDGTLPAREANSLLSAMLASAQANLLGGGEEN